MADETDCVHIIEGLRLRARDQQPEESSATMCSPSASVSAPLLRLGSRLFAREALQLIGEMGDMCLDHGQVVDGGSTFFQASSCDQRELSRTEFCEKPYPGGDLFFLHGVV